MSELNYFYTYQVAAERLAALNPVEVAANSGAGYFPEEGTYRLPFLNRDCLVEHASGKVNYLDGKDEVALRDKILILHYLETANGEPLTGRWITFKELPGGQVYIIPHTNRSIKPLINIFGEEPNKLLAAGTQLGGKLEKLGHTAITIQAFPRVPVALVLWQGDEEFGPSGNILFDSSAPGYLPTEDYAVLAQTLVGVLKKGI